jgi:hypothetical protein
MAGLTRRFLLASFFFTATSGGVSTAETAKRVALSGYDPISYFTDHRPEKGTPQFTADFDDATYWFRSAEHRAMFVADPDRYAPQYNGFCTIGISRGSKFEPDPKAWTISDGKLYVFTGPAGVPMFQEARASIVGQANANWPTVRRMH